MTLPEAVDAGTLGEDSRNQDQGDGQRGHDSEVGGADELDGAVCFAGAEIQREEGLNGGSDDGDQHGEDGGEEHGKEGGDGALPAETGVAGADYALGKNKICHEEEEYASGREDLGGDGDADIVLVGSPGDAHGQGDDAGHAEAEKESGEDKLVTMASVDLKDGHVGRGSADEEGEEDGADGYIEVGGG